MRKQAIANWYESQVWWPPTDFDWRLLDAFVRVGEVMKESDYRIFMKADPVIIPLTGENACVVPLPRTARVAIVFADKLQVVDDDALTFVVAHEIAHVVLRSKRAGAFDRETAADALAAEWGFKRVLHHWGGQRGALGAHRAADGDVCHERKREVVQRLAGFLEQAAVVNRVLALVEEDERRLTDSWFLAGFFWPELSDGSPLRGSRLADWKRAVFDAGLLDT